MGVLFFRFDPLTPEEPAEHIFRLLTSPPVTIEDKFTVVERAQVRQRSFPASR